MDLNEIRNLSDHSNEFDKFYSELLNCSINLPIDALFVEIGTRAGGSALLALKAINDSKINRTMITIDPYGLKPFVNSDRTNLRLYGENLYREALKNITDYCFYNELDHIHFKITSFDFIKIFEQIELWKDEQVLQPKFGYVYLDGEHNENTVTKELEYFLPRTVENGLIVIDDIEHIKNSNNPLIKNVLSESRFTGNRSFYTKKG